MKSLNPYQVRKKMHKGESFFVGREEAEQVKPLSVLFLLFGSAAKLLSYRLQLPLPPPPRSLIPLWVWSPRTARRRTIGWAL